MLISPWEPCVSNQNIYFEFEHSANRCAYISTGTLYILNFVCIWCYFFFLLLQWGSVCCCFFCFIFLIMMSTRMWNCPGKYSFFISSTFLVVNNSYFMTSQICILDSPKENTHTVHSNKAWNVILFRIQLFN